MKRSIVLSITLAVALAACGDGDGSIPLQRAAADKDPVVIDTDAGTDDLIAIALLLARRDVEIEAITVVNGLARVEPGAANVLGLLELAGRADIPVHVGAGRPLEGGASFPPAWRESSERVAGVPLPPPRTGPQEEGAVEFLSRRLFEASSPHVRVLALGPLTNIAQALIAGGGNAPARVRDVVVMGGAVQVPGNLAAGGETANTVAEWNVFVDPVAARRVFLSGLPIVLVPLDATGRVPFSREIADSVRQHEAGALAGFVSRLLEAEREAIERGEYHAWDPLAAVVLLHPGVATLREAHIVVETDPPATGRTRMIPGRPANARVAVDADARVFTEVFLAAMAGAR